MDNGVDDDDDDDIEAEIRRQLDALTESDLELEDDADWTTSLRDLAGLDNGLEDVNDQVDNVCRSDAWRLVYYWCFRM